MGRVEGKVALITGAASGLGAADARMLAREGARVVLTDVNEELGRQTAASIPGALFLRHDVRDEAQWQSVIAATVEHFGGLDVLVNNAGLVQFTSVEDTPLEQYRFVNAVMSEGTFLGCKHAIPAMRKTGRGGSIINISSIAAIMGIGEIASYTAAKGAIRSLTRSVAIHCYNKRDGIRCNVILPGAHETPMTASAGVALSDATSGALDQLNNHGQGSPEGVAAMVVFLASDESRHVTGAEFVIDGGETIR
ncbi:SDR family oxidoreductase [Zoogloea sp.]|uniref:SDR family oxidoreductase n=1 Tax=Zoogloea sp. TaxID=49181 RepID=UPI002611B388|nr:SDR family oxidoreductase [Zoogloea sp.]MDD3352078.1 SDR family oxidoreductase [Zoogloea sp.]